MFRELTPLETYEELSQKSDAVLIDLSLIHISEPTRRS